MTGWNVFRVRRFWIFWKFPSAAGERPFIGAWQNLAELGWTAVRVRDLTRGGYKEQLRGYCRDARCRSTVPDRERAHAGSAL